MANMQWIRGELQEDIAASSGRMEFRIPTGFRRPLVIPCTNLTAGTWASIISVQEDSERA